MVAHAYIRSTLGGCLSQGVRAQPGQHSKTPTLIKKKKCQACWHVPIVPATWEAKAEGLLNPRNLMLHYSKL